MEVPGKDSNLCHRVTKAKGACFKEQMSPSLAGVVERREFWLGWEMPKQKIMG